MLAFVSNRLAVVLAGAAECVTCISSSDSAILLNTLTLLYLLIFAGATGATRATSPNGAVCSGRLYALCWGDWGDKYLKGRLSRLCRTGRGDCYKPRGTRRSPVSPQSPVK